MRKWLFYLIAGYVWKRVMGRGKVATTAPIGRSRSIRVR